jgi:hypothetical protein
MAIGSSQSTGERISQFERGLVPAGANIKEGYVVAHASITDDHVVDLPNAAGALLSGRAYAGVNASAGLTTTTDNEITVQRLGVAKCVLKPNTPCTAGDTAAYDPADGGTVVPYSSKAQVIIGKFTQTKLTSTSEQMVGVFLSEESNAKSDTLLGAITTTSGNVTNTTVETAFDQKVTIPANALVAGSVLRIEGGVYIPTANSTDTLTLKVKLGTVVLAASAAIDPANTGDWGTFFIEVNCRSLTQLVAKGTIGIAGTVTNSGTAGPQAYSAVVANDITVTATWSVANASNVVRLENLSVSQF